MAENSKIEWTDHTVNPWWGCTKVHEGCDHCYAEVLSNRWGFKVWGNDAPRKITKFWERDLMRYQAWAYSLKKNYYVFVGSMMDIFEKPMPLVDHKGNPLEQTTGDIRNHLFNTVVPKTPNLTYLFLTKRPSNINKYIPEEWKINPPKNVIFGTSPVNQETADKLIPQLLAVNGRRFLSIEPQLGPLTITFKQLEKIDWVICGGESGHGRRPFNTDWARWLRDCCAVQGKPFFMKQIDKKIPIPEDLMIREFPR